jgi:hypothetical protein
LLARAFVPLALLFILSGCGGGTPSETVSTRVLHGPGFSFSVPRHWQTSVSSRAASAVRGRALVSVQTFPLLKRYDPARFDAATKELDGIARKLAAEAGGQVKEMETATVDGRKIRVYTYDSTKIGFFLVDKREYQLLCRLGAGGSDTDGACSLLFSSFSVT